MTIEATVTEVNITEVCAQLDTAMEPLNAELKQLAIQSEKVLEKIEALSADIGGRPIAEPYVPEYDPLINRINALESLLSYPVAMVDEYTNILAEEAKKKAA